MSKNIEYEKRIMLNKAQYHQILHDFLSLNCSFTKISQLNIYLDDNEHNLINNHKVLRIRYKNRKPFELTLKIKSDNGDIEYNQQINKKLTNKLIKTGIFPVGEVKQILSKYVNINDIHVITKLKTIRYEFKIENNLIVIDKNYYNHKKDYNLEVESNSNQNAENAILEITQKYNLKYDKNYISKSRRAFNSLNSII